MRTCGNMPLCLTGLMLIALPLAQGSDWHQFRGLGAGGRSDDRGLPETWSDSNHVIWKTALPGRGASSPVVFGDRVYLTAYSGFGLDAENPGNPQDLRLHVLCIDRNTGDLLWDRSVTGSPNSQEATARIVDHGYASSTAACDETGVYAFFGVSGVVAFDPDGEQKWRADVGARTAGFGSAASPVLHGDLLIVNAGIESHSVVALDKTSGETVWTIPEVRQTWTTPLIASTNDGQDELVIPQKDIVRGFDPRTGHVLWTCEGIDDYVVPCAIAHDGIAYVLGGRSNRAIAVRLGGRGDVTQSHQLWSARVGANVTSPTYWEGRLYWASDRGIANCIDAASGEIVYQQRLPTRERAYASAVLADGKIYVTTRENGVIVLAIGAQYKQLAQNRLAADEGLINATPAISRSQLLLRTDGRLYCIGEDRAATP
jgi:outer membrane protein assembly factor BamB